MKLPCSCAGSQARLTKIFRQLKVQAGTWGYLQRASAHFCISGIWEPARLPQKGQWTQISCFFSSKLGPCDRFSLPHVPLQSEFSAVPVSFDACKYLLSSLECEVPLFYCVNLILQKTKPKDLELPRCHFFILWHAQKFCCNFLLSSLGLMSLKRIIGRK